MSSIYFYDDKTNYGIDYMFQSFYKPYELIKLELEKDEIENLVDHHLKVKWITAEIFKAVYKPKIDTIDNKINDIINKNIKLSLLVFFIKLITIYI